VARKGGKIHRLKGPLPTKGAFAGKKGRNSISIKRKDGEKKKRESRRREAIGRKSRRFRKGKREQEKEEGLGGKA